MSEELLYKDYFDHFNSLITKEETASKQAYFDTIGKKLFELIAMGRCLHNLKVVKRVHAFARKDFDSRDFVETRWQITLESMEYDKLQNNSFVVGSNVFFMINVSENISFKESYSKVSGIIINVNNRSITIELPDTREGIYNLHEQITLVLGSDKVTYTRQRELLKYFCSSFYDGEEDIRDQIISIFRDQFESNLIQSTQRVDSYFFKLDKSKKEAVEKILGPNKISLLHGPPGTGKTQACAEIICQTLKQDTSKRILVCCDSNQAVDNILSKVDQLLPNPSNNVILRVGQPFKVQKDVVDYTLFAKYNDHPLNKYFLPLLYEESQHLEKAIKELKKRSVDALKQKGRNSTEAYDSHEEYKIAQKSKFETQQQITNVRNSILKEINNNARIFFCTNSLAGTPEIRSMKFDLVVIDEATQATEPSIIIPLSLGKKVVLAGDHKQLPPTVLSQEKNKISELSVSLFEKIILKDKNLASTLKIQYRMNDDILNFPNKQFYSNLESAEENKNKHLDLIFEKSVVFIDSHVKENTSQDSDESDEDLKSKFNEGEVNIVSKVVSTLRSLTLTNRNIMVLTPYNLQKQKLNNALKEFGIKSKTVDEGQGQQSDIVILSLVRNNDESSLGFLKDKRRFNVAITRAKVKLIVIGNIKTLSSDELYDSWLDNIRHKGMIIDEADLDPYLALEDSKIEELKDKVSEYRIVKPTELYDKKTSDEFIEENDSWFKSLDYALLSKNLELLFSTGWSIKKPWNERLGNIYPILTAENAKNILLTFYWISLRKIYSLSDQKTPYFMKLAEIDRKKIEDFCYKKGFLTEEEIIEIKGKMEFVDQEIKEIRTHNLFKEDKKEAITECKIVTNLFS
ncbi:MAG: IGHMBP2 family helicase [Nanoarchaeota archaeon]|nr:IGHMBP2 family helicase [Nanoarchaeota archaeon]